MQEISREQGDSGANPPILWLDLFKADLRDHFVEMGVKGGATRAKKTFNSVIRLMEACRPDLVVARTEKTGSRKFLTKAGVDLILGSEDRDAYKANLVEGSGLDRPPVARYFQLGDDSFRLFKEFLGEMYPSEPNNLE